jgi:hypothetical protein
MSTKDPSLDEIATMPALAEELPAPTRARLIGRASVAIAALAAAGTGGDHGDASEDWISPEAAAALLGFRSKRTLLRAPAGKYPFLKRLSRRNVRISRSGLDTWMKSRRS